MRFCDFKNSFLKQNFINVLLVANVDESNLAV